MIPKRRAPPLGMLRRVPRVAKTAVEAIRPPTTVKVCWSVLLTSPLETDEKAMVIKSSE